MPSPQRDTRQTMTAEEFLAWPGNASGTRYQLVDGELRAMSPATVTHGTIQLNLGALLRDYLNVPGNPCRAVAEPAVAVRVRAADNVRVPDLGVSCTPEHAGDVVLADPILLVEILSPGNKAATWTNVWAYTTIASLREILIVSSYSVEAEVLRRQDDGTWPEAAERVGADDILHLTSIGFEVPLKAIYAKTYLG